MTLVLLAVIATASTVTAAYSVLICVRLGRSLTRVFLSAEAAEEAATIRQVTVVDALLRIEESGSACRADVARVGGHVNVATELGYQNAEAAERMETADEVVAEHLAAAVARADAAPNHGRDGAAADAANRSPLTQREETP